MNKNLSIKIIANAALGPSMSGGDRIFIECARRWAKMGHSVTIYGWEEAMEMCQRNKLTGVELHLWPLGIFKKTIFAVNYALRTIKGCVEAFKIKRKTGEENIIIYSASDFWPDSIPAFIISRKLKAKWAAGFYLFAPNPFKGFNNRICFPKIKNILYYLGQKPVYWIIKKYANRIFVTFDLDIIPFERSGVPRDKICAIYGGVDIEEVALSEPKEKDLYTACFVGRFHPQKGLKELVEAWKIVCDSKKNSKLALIGTGDKEWVNWLKSKIKKDGMDENIDLLGFLDGIRKYEILKSSKVYLCTNLYDSGGMATIEAMAAGLPVVSFDIPAVKSLIFQGTIRVPFRDSKAFGEAVINLLNDQVLYGKIKNEALQLASEWDWNKRAVRTLNFIDELF